MNSTHQKPNTEAYLLRQSLCKSLSTINELEHECRYYKRVFSIILLLNIISLFMLLFQLQG